MLYRERFGQFLLIACRERWSGGSQERLDRNLKSGWEITYSFVEKKDARIADNGSSDGNTFYCIDI
jgi:hypothetical protein